MHAPLSRFAEPTYAVMRVVVRLLFAFHGAMKLFGLFGGTARPIASQMGLAGIIEFAGGLLIMVGLFAGLRAFIASGQIGRVFSLPLPARRLAR